MKTWDEIYDNMHMVVRIVDHYGNVKWFSEPVPKGNVDLWWKAPCEGWLDCVGIGPDILGLVPLPNVFGEFQFVLRKGEIHLFGTGKIVQSVV